MLIIKKIDNADSMADVNRATLDPSIYAVSVEASYFYDRGLTIKNLLAADFIKELPSDLFVLNVNLIATRPLVDKDYERIGRSISDITPNARVILSSVNFPRKTLSCIRKFAFGGEAPLFEMDVASTDCRNLASHNSGHMLLSPSYRERDQYEHIILTHYVNNNVPVILDWTDADSISKLNASVQDKSKILLLTKEPDIASRIQL